VASSKPRAAKAKEAAAAAVALPVPIKSGVLGRIRMRQALKDGTILVLEWHDSPKEWIGKEHGRVHGREQEDLLAPARGSLWSRQAKVGG
jgi:hypothetical protein